MGLGQNCRECPTTALYRHPADQATAMPSKHQFHSKLDLPRRAGFTGWEARGGNPAKRRRADNIPRLPEVRVVEKVEELSPELRARSPIFVFLVIEKSTLSKRGPMTTLRPSNFQAVQAGREGRDLEGAAAIALRDPLHTGRLAARRNFNAGHGCAFWVYNSALQCRSGLGMGRRKKGQE